MGRLNWIDAPDLNKWKMPAEREGFIKTNNTTINLDLMDLCEGRFWGGHKILISFNFSIHKRKCFQGGTDWTHQLLAPNGVHIYLHSVEEGKEIAEVIFDRMLKSLFQPPIEVQLPPEPPAEVSNSHYFKRILINKTKNKRAKLHSMLSERKVGGEVYYSNSNPKGWMHLWRNGDSPQRLGYDYAQAVELIEAGTMDFMANG